MIGSWGEFMWQKLINRMDCYVRWDLEDKTLAVAIKLEDYSGGITFSGFVHKCEQVTEKTLREGLANLYLVNDRYLPLKLKRPRHNIENELIRTAKEGMEARKLTY